MRQFWHIFLEAERRSGIKFNPKTGMLRCLQKMRTRSNAGTKLLIEGVTRKSLPLGKGVSYSTWAEVFKPDIPHRGSMIEDGDDAGFLAAEAGFGLIHDPVPLSSGDEDANVDNT